MKTLSLSADKLPRDTQYARHVIEEGHRPGVLAGELLRGEWRPIQRHAKQVRAECLAAVAYYLDVWPYCGTWFEASTAQPVRIVVTPSQQLPWWRRVLRWLGGETG